MVKPEGQHGHRAVGLVAVNCCDVLPPDCQVSEEGNTGIRSVGIGGKDQGNSLTVMNKGLHDGPTPSGIRIHQQSCSVVPYDPIPYCPAVNNERPHCRKCGYPAVHGLMEELRLG